VGIVRCEWKPKGKSEKQSEEGFPASSFGAQKARFDSVPRLRVAGENPRHVLAAKEGSIKVPSGTGMLLRVVSGAAQGLRE
jgi:hypothetical protein